MSSCLGMNVKHEICQDHKIEIGGKFLSCQIIFHLNQNEVDSFRKWNSIKWSSHFDCKCLYPVSIFVPFKIQLAMSCPSSKIQE